MHFTLERRLSLGHHGNLESEGSLGHYMFSLLVY